ncbi:TBC1 domain member 4 [Saguinus oedipus]|uniref:TBC1 domain member 4 n=1 Tax=Saguinus oedipus TaxID=9490 RepID=A0ABQ9WD53_SAGOE|nr:TBC1 domain member 4 [Saguinus oedipus]
MDISKQLHAYEVEYHVLQDELQESSYACEDSEPLEKLERANSQLKRQNMDLLEKLQTPLTSTKTEKSPSACLENAVFRSERENLFQHCRIVSGISCFSFSQAIAHSLRGTPVAHAKIQTLESNLENLLTRETKMKSLIRTLEQEKMAYQKTVEQLRKLLPADALANCELLLRDLNCNPNNKAKIGNKP